MDQPTSAATNPTLLRRLLAIVLSLDSTGYGHVVMGHVRSGAYWYACSLLPYAGFVVAVVAGIRWLMLLSIVLVIALRISATVSTARLAVPLSAPRKLILVAVIVGMYSVGFGAGLVGVQFARAYRTPTPSMYPLLEVGDYFVSSKVLPKPARGQVIVYLYPPDQTKSFIHRIIGLPGDTVEMRQGELILNGKQIDHQRLDDPCNPACTLWQESIDGNSYKVALMNKVFPGANGRNFGPSRVPDGQLFVLGDNRDNSMDSRYWGFVPIALVQAEPRFFYWSVGENGIRWDRLTKAVE